jgi:hypothetical protein
MQNSNLSVTKATYFEICEQMGNEPIESEIPVEFEDLPIELQQALLVYRLLQDQWEGMNGIYLGKSLVGIQDIFEYLEITDLVDKKFIFQLIKTIDGIRSEQINNKKPA